MAQRELQGAATLSSAGGDAVRGGDGEREGAEERNEAEGSVVGPQRSQRDQALRVAARVAAAFASHPMTHWALTPAKVSGGEGRTRWPTNAVSAIPICVARSHAPARAGPGAGGRSAEGGPTVSRIARRPAVAEGRGRQAWHAGGGVGGRHTSGSAMAAPVQMSVFDRMVRSSSDSRQRPAGSRPAAAGSAHAGSGGSLSRSDASASGDAYPASSTSPRPGLRETAA